MALKVVEYTVVPLRRPDKLIQPGLRAMPIEAPKKIELAAVIRCPHLWQSFKILPPAEGPGGDSLKTWKMVARLDRRCFQNPAPDPLGVATGPPMQTQSSLEGALCPIN